MNLFRPLTVSLALLGAALCAGLAQAQDNGTVNDAFQTARQAVSSDVQTKVISVYGVGTPTTIQKWYIIFFDPSVASHGRAVLVENNQIAKTYPAAIHTTYAANLTFDPSRISSEAPALSAAQGYAAKHHIIYDGVHALLKEVGVSKPFRWRIELLDSGRSKGFVYINALDDTVASYSEPSESRTSTKAQASAEGFGDGVKDTFLGIGGDLQEFFTGERSVDK